MKLTVVLVTQPKRLEYFKLSLEALAEALRLNSQLHLFVIFNGHSDKGLKALEPLKEMFNEKVNFTIIQQNSPLPNQVVEVIRRAKLHWIHLPGDDDQVIPETYRAFFSDHEHHPESIAFGYSATAIDSSGLPTGKVLRPLDIATLRREKVLAQAIHKPPFVWPSLIFDFSRIPNTFFSSRFVFDWWIGIQLLLEGPIFTSKKSLVRYRIHHNQESHMATETRKRFEAEIMMQQVILDANFWQAVNLLEDRGIYLDELLSYSPVFGDPFFGSSILLMLTSRLTEFDSSAAHKFEKSMMGLASSHGVYFSMKEFPLRSSMSSRDWSNLNFNCTEAPGSCDYVVKGLGRVLDREGPLLCEVSCNHTRSVTSNGNSILINCDHFNEMSHSEIDSEIIQQMESSLSSNLRHDSQLAPWEKHLITLARRLLKNIRKLKRAKNH